MNGLIDTHFHLDMYKNHKQVCHYLETQKIYTLCMTNSPGIYVSCQNLYGNSRYVKFALGFHPLNAELKEKDFRDFMWMLPNINYVGEIGLDYSRKTGIGKEKQKLYFSKIVAKCSELNKLMSVHIRGAEQDAIEIFEQYTPKKCIIHWFSGNEKQLHQLIDIGCYFSLNANMVESMPELLKYIPRDKILIESDGPYSKVAGKKYRPEYLLQEYQIIAKALNEPDLVWLVYNNFRDILSS